MNKIKVYLDIPKEVKKDLQQRGKTLDSVLKKQGLEVHKEELNINGENATRGVFTTIILGGLGYLAVKVADKVIDKILDPIVDKALEPITKRLEKGKKENENITINVFYVINTQIEGEKKLIPVELSNDEEILELKENILIKVEKELIKK